jgi:hypothetical protein
VLLLFTYLLHSHVVGALCQVFQAVLGGWAAAELLYLVYAVLFQAQPLGFGPQETPGCLGDRILDHLTLEAFPSFSQPSQTAI